MKFTLATLVAVSVISSGALGAAIPKSEKTHPTVIVELNQRGLVDSITGAVPGILSLVTGIVTGLLTSVEGVVGSLLLQENGDGSHTTTPSSTNATQVYLVQVNSTLPNVTATTTGAFVQIHAPVWNRTDMTLMDLCLSYANTTTLAAKPCQTDAAEQLFMYNATTNAVQPAVALDTPCPAHSPTADASSDIAGTLNEYVIERDADAASCDAPTMSIVFTPAVTNSIIRVAPVPAPTSNDTGSSVSDNGLQQD